MRKSEVSSTLTVYHDGQLWVAWSSVSKTAC